MAGILLAGHGSHNAQSSKARVSGHIATHDDEDDEDSLSRAASSHIFINSKVSPQFPWTQMPDSAYYDPNEQMKVALNVVVLNLADISTANLCYNMRLELWVAWPLTKEELKSYIENPDSFRPNVHPEPVPWTISIESNQKMKFLTGRTTQVFFWRGKIVACECSLITARYLETFELEHFPFDCQHLNFHIALRCDTDMPLKILEDGRLQYNTIESMEGFLNFDGRCLLIPYV
jgi:hypothetical protein